MERIKKELDKLRRQLNANEIASDYSVGTETVRYYLDSIDEAIKDFESKKSDAVEFAEWVVENNYTKYEHRLGDEIVNMGKWYNTINYKSMINPLTSDELYQQFLTTKQK